MLLIHRKVHEFTEVCLKPSLLSSEVAPSFWVPPPLSWIKVNVDAAWTSAKAALAVVARDSHRSPLLVEAEALLWAVSIAKREKWSHVLFEGDSKIYINALCSVSNSTNWVIQPSISSILSLVQCFVSFLLLGLTELVILLRM